MKVLIISKEDGYSPNSGGAPIAARRLFEGLYKIGVEVKMLTLNSGCRTNVYPIYNKTTISGKISYYTSKILQKILFEESSNRNSKHYPHSRAKSAFTKIVEHELFNWADVVNIHWVGGFLNFNHFFRHCGDKKIFWTLHDMNPFTGGCHYSEGCLGFLSECLKCPQKNSNRPSKNLQIKLAQSFNNLLIITPSKWLNNLSAQSRVFNGLKHLVIPNCVNTEIFFYNKKVRKKTSIYKNNCLFIASNTSLPIKGLQFIAEIISDLNPSVNINIIGMKKSRESQKNMNYLGVINDEEKLAEQLNRADFFIIPSLEENFPNVIVESLCCGTPVVGFDTGGIPEMISEGYNGFLAKKGDAQSLKEKILKACTWTWDNTQISKNAREKYSEQIICHEYLNAFKLNPESLPLLS